MFVQATDFRFEVVHHCARFAIDPETPEQEIKRLRKQTAAASAGHALSALVTFIVSRRLSALSSRLRLCT
jgi:hypothetical protein